MLLGSCDSLRVFEAVGKANAILGTLVTLLNAPSFQSVCGAKAAAVGTARATSILTQGAAQGDPIQAATLKVLGEKPAAVTAKTSSTTGGTPAPAAGR